MHVSFKSTYASVRRGAFALLADGDAEAAKAGASAAAQASVFEGERPRAHPAPPELCRIFEDAAARPGDPLQPPIGGRLVWYRGNPKAPLMVVGEGPGADEDRLGYPFVGRAGQLLDRILESVDIDPLDDVYITNVVKRRPPNNRTPTDLEVAWHLPTLLAEIDALRPRVIVLAGTVAMRAVLGERRGITAARGHWAERHGAHVVPIFHPSYLLRNPQREKGTPKYLTWCDMREVKRRLGAAPAEAGGAPAA
eukprot:tig00020614_g12192.t2